MRLVWKVFFQKTAELLSVVTRPTHDNHDRNFSSHASYKTVVNIQRRQFYMLKHWRYINVDNSPQYIEYESEIKAGKHITSILKGVKYCALILVDRRCSPQLINNKPIHQSRVQDTQQDKLLRYRKHVWQFCYFEL